MPTTDWASGWSKVEKNTINLFLCGEWENERHTGEWQFVNEPTNNDVMDVAGWDCLQREWVWEVFSSLMRLVKW
jgi:hypothetical protein